MSAVISVGLYSDLVILNFIVDLEDVWWTDKGRKELRNKLIINYFIVLIFIVDPEDVWWTKKGRKELRNKLKINYVILILCCQNNAVISTTGTG